MQDLEALLNPKGTELVQAHGAPADIDSDADLDVIEEDQLDVAKVKLRAFNDYDKLRDDIHKKVIGALATAYPKENDKYILKLSDLQHDNKRYSLLEQKKAIQSGKSLTTKLKGTWSLIDKSTQQPVAQSVTTIANIPWLTNRGTFVRNGSESTIVNQLRLKPGIYTRQKASGEVEAHVNTEQGSGTPFKLLLEPSTGIFKIKAGQSNWKLYPLLSAMGVSDEEIAKSWGEEILKVNKDKYDVRVVQKAYEKLVPKKIKALVSNSTDLQQLGKALRNSFEQARINPKVTAATLGIPSKHLDMSTLLRASNKVLNISKGTESVDSRDALPFQQIMSPDDLLAERIKKDSGKLGSSLLWRATYRKGLDDVKPGVLSAHFDSLFNGSGLSQNLEEINPMDAFDQSERITILGDGGLSSMDMVPDEAREVQPSYFMFIDPVRSPESLKVGIDNRLTRVTKKGDDGNLYTRVISAKTGKPVYITPRKAAQSIVAFPGDMESDRSKVRVMINGTTFGVVDRSKVDFYGSQMQDMFSHSSNLSPMTSSIKPGRLLMAGKFSSQALPLRDAEAPLVRMSSGGLGDKSVEEELGTQMGAVRAKKGGKVVKVTRDAIVIEHPDGIRSTQDIYDNFSFNRKTYIASSPVVAVGDVVEDGALLAKSNYTDKDGVTALGKNLRVAYLSYKGLNYDDGQVISRSAANKLASEHMYTHDIDKNKGTFFDKNKFSALFPKKFNNAQLKAIDDNGIIQVGTLVQPGDPLILATTATKPVNSLLRDNRKTYNKDSSVTWDHSDVGVVTDVYDTKGGVNVVVKAYSPTQVGDKLSGRHADKGVISAIIEDDQMPHDENGQPYEMLASPLGITSRVNPAQLTETWLAKIARKTGKHYSMPPNMSTSFIQFAKDELKKHGLSETETVINPENGKALTNVHAGERFIMKLHHTAEAKRSARGTGLYTSEEQPAHGGKEGAKRFCFAPKQLVKTANGDVQIEKIVEERLSVEVFSYNWKKENFCYQPVIGWHKRKVLVTELIQIDIEGALGVQGICSMYVTKEHTLYKVDGSTITAGQVRIGDDLATEKTLERIPCYVVGIHAYVHDDPNVTEITVYDLTVEETHVYTASGVLVSNSNMEIGALISHGATEVLRDAKLVKAQRNDEFWREFKLGKNPAPKGVPFIYKKFLDSLQASGVNVTKTNDSVNIFAMTNKNVDELATNEIKHGDTLDQKEGKPIPGGLFDVEATGGLDGNRWSYIKLDNPVPNPVMEDPLRSILGMTKKQFYDVVAGKTPVHGMYGGAGLKKVLSAINLDKELTQARAAITTVSASRRDAAIKRYKYLKAMKRNGTQPADFMLDKIPVLPPAYRPISELPSGTKLVPDVNYLYKDLLDARDDLRELTPKLDKADLQDEQLKIYNAYKAITGVGDPVSTKSQEGELKGILKGIFGSSPKLGSFQRRTVGMSLDVVGRSTIVPNPKFNMDEVGLPLNAAWDLYKPFIIRELVKNGMPAQQASVALHERKQSAFEALQRVIKQRPVLVNRAPTLHKYGLMAAWPTLVDGDALQISPVVTPAYAADFDGNCVAFDSKIKLKVSKLALDSTGFSKYTSLDNKISLKEKIMQTNLAVVSTAVNGNYQFSMQIGDFPRVGTPIKDKNGADVYAVPDGVEVSSFDVVTGTHVWKKVKNFTAEKDCKCVDVKIGSHTITVSDNESLAVFNPDDGALIKIAPKDAIKRFVPILKKNPLPFGEFGTRDLGWWIGAFLSDGWLSNNTVGYAKLEECKRTAFINIARKELCDNFTYREYAAVAGEKKLGNSKKIHCTGEDLATVVKAYNLTAVGTADHRQCLNKELPSQYIEGGSEDFLFGVLSGLLDGDGSFSKNMKTGKPRFSARFSTSSISLKKSVESLCYRLGIRCNTTVTPPRGFSKEAYSITFSTVDMYKCLDKLTCIGEKEVGILKEWKLHAPNTKFTTDVVPLTHEEVVDIANHAKTLRNNTMVGIVRKEKEIPRCSLSTVEQLISAGYPGIEQLVARAFGDVLWVTVDSVEDVGTHDVFDLEVEDTKVFTIGNGVVIWDTMQYHVPVSDSAVKEAVEKMMPSKNLLAVEDFKPHFLPRMEFLQGLYLASRGKSNDAPKVFNTIEEAKKAYNQGKIKLSDNVKILSLGKQPGQS